MGSLQSKGLGPVMDITQTPKDQGPNVSRSQGSMEKSHIIAILRQVIHIPTKPSDIGDRNGGRDAREINRDEVREVEE